MLRVTDLVIHAKSQAKKQTKQQLKQQSDSSRDLNTDINVKLSFEVAAGEVLSIMGPSGSGKSTVLNWLIGALPDAFEATGELYLNDQLLNGLTTQQRQIGILFQNDMLFPHLSVGANLAFAVPSDKGDKGGKAERKAVIEEALAGAGMDGFYSRDPATLSGGQRARVSVLQTLLAEPKAVLLDEPFSRLDKDRREQFRAFVFQRITALNIPALLVTHDDEDTPENGRIITLGE